MRTGEDTVSSEDAGLPAGGKPFPFFENETVEEGDKTFLPYFLSSLAACLHGRPGLRVCTGVNVGGANCT
jgi:hypothetical protein